MLDRDSEGGSTVAAGERSILEASAAAKVTPGPGTGPPLLGRDLEVGVIDRLIDGIGGRGGSLVIRGEPGIGKSALLAHAARRAEAHEVRVLTTTGVASETHLPFAGLHQLLRPLLSEAEMVEDSQREVILGAFGLRDAHSQEIYRIALAVLDLLSSSAACTPIVVIAEDAHWLDHSTCEVLAFVARRLESDPIVLLAASREVPVSSLAETGLPELRLAGLGAHAARQLLEAYAPGLSSSARERVLAEASGNPLGLVELPIALQRATGPSALPSWLPLTTRLERAFADRASELPAVTRALLLVTALNDRESLAEALSGASLVTGVDADVQDATSAVDAGLLVVGEAGITFRHPLVRSALHHLATATELKSAHAALAAVLDAQPDRAIWHRAAATVGPDEALAAELDTTAARSQRRGAVQSAVEALERAARLTADLPTKHGRLLRAGELALSLGQRETVARLLHEVEPTDLSPLDAARKSWIIETLDPGITGDPAVVIPLIDAADRARQAGDNELALSLLWAAASNSFWANRSNETHDAIATVAARVEVAPDDPRVLSIIAYVAPDEQVREITERFARWSPDPTADPVGMQLLGNAAFMVGAHPLASCYLTASADALREQGRLVPLAQSLVMRAWSEIHLGRWHVAMPDTEEAAALASETAQPIWEAGANVAQAYLRALRGEEEWALDLAATAEAVVLPAGGRAVIAVIQLTRGVAALAAGRHDEAFAHFSRMLDPTDLSHHRMTSHWAIGNLAEAAAHCGRVDEARAMLAELEPKAAGSPSPAFAHAMRHARALLADDADAEPLFASGLAPTAEVAPFERARLQLAYGVWLRRRRRVTEARAPLRAARDTFDAIGALPWGERARQELRASGETSRRRTPDARDHLSPQELQIAQMAAAGFTNRQIGVKLFLSHRTIGSHLYRIFPKLDITSRSELAGALQHAAP